MPVYEYECPQCEKVLEVQQRMTDEPLSTCPECGGAEVKKLISMSSFQLKGGGWYADGYSETSEKKNTNKTTTINTPPVPPCKGGDSPCKSCPAAVA